MSSERKILVGTISGAHGVKGLVRLKSFTAEPDAIFRYKPLTGEDGHEFTIKPKSSTNNHFIVEVKGVADRDQAEALHGTKLFVSRTALPKLKKREFYESDLVGLKAKDAKGKDCGVVAAVHNYGGGPFLEIEPPEGKAFMLPFNKECVPEVDVEEGEIVIAPPEDWLQEDSSQKTEIRNEKPRHSPPLAGGVRGGVGSARTHDGNAARTPLLSSPARGEERLRQKPDKKG